MTRIPTPTSIDTSPVASRPLLEAVQKQLGSVPNLFRVLGNSPAGLEVYLGLNGALGKGALDVKTRNRIALVVAQENGCDYCLSAHTYLGKNLARLEDAEMSLNRDATPCASRRRSCAPGDTSVTPSSRRCARRAGAMRRSSRSSSTSR